MTKNTIISSLRLNTVVKPKSKSKSKLKVIIQTFELREDIKIKKPADLVKIASFTLPPSHLLKEWKTKEWNIGMSAKSEKFGCF